MKGRRGHPLTGRAVLALFIGLFALVFAVNGIFTYFALASWPGFSQSDAYRTGLRYNQVLEQARKQAELGWTSTVHFSAEGLFLVAIADSQGWPVEGLEVSVALARPISETRDLNLVLDPFDDGVYGTRIAASVAGRWHAVVLAEDAEGHRYRMVHEIVVKP